MTTSKYTYKDALEHLGGTKVVCYLTGTLIDIEKDEFNIDHIIPVSKGGSNELDNMAIVIPAANSAKTNLTLDEYLELCKKVLENFGYIVTK